MLFTLNGGRGQRILISDNEDTWFTNGETYSQLIYLGKEDSPDNWRIISDKEYSEASSKN